MRTCSLDGCDRIHVSRDLCSLHYQRWRKHGDPLREPIIDVAERFWAKVDKNGPIHPRLGTRCWLWTACLNEHGYGKFRVGGRAGRTEKAHRVAYEFLIGPVSSDLDHMCHNTLCVNPAHLRPVSSKQNQENRQGPQQNNRSSGYQNVYPIGDKWEVKVGHNGASIYAGCFDTREEAAVVARNKRLELFTHNDFDREAR